MTQFELPEIGSSEFYRYHQSTKHTVEKLYGTGWSLDWANQPDPFRRYVGAEDIQLPPPRSPGTVAYFQAVEREPQPWDIQHISQLLYYSMAISAWKEIKGQGARWSLRVNPSSGNLHPTETHLVVCDVEGLEDGVYHFRANDFVLERRAGGDVRPLLGALQQAASATPTPVTILLSSIFWREAWKYRDRAFRYCHHDLGHAIASLGECLTGLGHRPRYSHRFDDRVVAGIFGLTDTDEVPGVVISTSTESPMPPSGSDAGIKSPGLTFTGEPNALSQDAIEYESIARVYRATEGTTAEPPHLPEPQPLFDGPPIPLPERTEEVADRWSLVRQRRSAVDFDGSTGITAEQFGAILFRATQSHQGDVAGFRHGDGGGFLIHLFLYVHRVQGVDTGIYYYNRAAHALIPHQEGDVRALAARLSLGQDIAADSAFAVSMIADFPRAMALFGERGYRAAHIEAGTIGQGLYLGAEAVGVQGTGIGAFFDDDVNFFLRLPAGFEVIYHFTVGGAVEDPRIQTCKSYEFEEPGE